MRLKIISDGTSKGTHVVDEDTNQEVRFVQDIKWEISAKGVSKAYLTILNVPIELLVNKVYLCEEKIR